MFSYNKSLSWTRMVSLLGKDVAKTQNENGMKRNNYTGLDTTECTCYFSVRNGIWDFHKAYSVYIIFPYSQIPVTVPRKYDRYLLNSDVEMQHWLFLQVSNCPYLHLSKLVALAIRTNDSYLKSKLETLAKTNPWLYRWWIRSVWGVSFPFQPVTSVVCHIHVTLTYKWSDP
jgi:hypothetical protein